MRYRKRNLYRQTSKEFRTAERITDIISSCKRKGIECDLEVDNLNWPDTCPVLGIELNYFNNITKENSPSIDRFDPTKGYTKDNVWVISRKANTMKSSATLPELKKFADWINSL